MRWLRTRRGFDVACGLVLAAAVAVGATGTYVIQLAGARTEVSLDDVLRDFRAPTAPTPTAAQGSPDPAVPRSPAVPSTGRAAQADPAGTTDPDGPGAPPDEVPPAGGPAEGTTTPATTAIPAPAASRPPEGVYRFAAEGEESVSLAGGNRRYPSEVYGIVRHTTCGYQLEVRLLEEHIDRTDFCTDARTVSLVSEHKEISFFGQTDSGAIVCDPPMLLLDRHAAPGPAATHACGAGSVTTTGTVVHTGGESHAIESQQVTGERVEWRWTSSGRSEGSGRHVWVLDVQGMPIRIERSSTNTSDSVLGKVRYDETATLTLQSRQPLR